MHLFRSRPHAPIRRLHARRTQMLAGAAATAVAMGVLVGPAGDLDAFGSIDRAQAAAAEPAAAPAPASPAFPDVPGVDLVALGYRGVDLDAVTVAALDRPLPELPMERASELRARIVVATAHVEGLREAEYLLYEAARSMKRDVRATRKHHEQALAVQAEADAAVARARERAREAAERAAEAAAAVEVPTPDDRPAPGDRTPAGPGGDAARAGDELKTGGASEAEAVVLAAQLSHAEAVAARASAGSAAVDERLQRQVERRAAHVFALARSSAQARRIDLHIEYLYNELHAARAGMRAAGRWLAEAERGRADVPTVQVKDFRVHGSVASSLRDLLRAAWADGILLTDASSYRPIDRQIELRKQNCGPTDYDIYQRPSGTCSPPTARPGRSLHESGLAVDFQHDGQSIVSRSSPAYRWLAANAPSYGFFNLPSEPWHWSVAGY